MNIPSFSATLFATPYFTPSLILGDSKNFDGSKEGAPSWNLARQARATQAKTGKTMVFV